MIPSEKVGPGLRRADVHAVVLETDGSFSVMGSASEDGDSALRNVAGWKD